MLAITIKNFKLYINNGNLPMQKRPIFFKPNSQKSLDDNCIFITISCLLLFKSDKP